MTRRSQEWPWRDGEEIDQGKFENAVGAEGAERLVSIGMREEVKNGGSGHELMPELGHWRSYRKSFEKGQRIPSYVIGNKATFC